MIEVKIKKAYPGFQLNVDFSIKGEVLTLFGPSGSGKSMTLQCISGLIKPDEGYINLNGRVVFDSKKGISLLPRERRIGYIFQNYALFPHMTVRKNIAFGICGISKNEMNERINYLIRDMRLNGLEDRYPGQLSGGQQQRVALARALAMEPELLLMDEPFSALDSHVKEELEKEVFDIQKFYHGGIIFVTHDLSEACRVSSKIGIYEDGRLLQIDDKHSIISRPSSRKAAALMGFRNIMYGIIADLGNSEITIKEKNSGACFFASIPNLDDSLALNKEIMFTIRSEYIEIKNENDCNTFSVQLTDIIESIATIRLIFCLGQGNEQQQIYVEVLGITKKSFEIGKTYRLYLPPERLVILTK